MSAVRVSAYVAKFWANRSNEETITAARTIQPMGLVGWRMAINRPTTAINANVSTANKRIPGPPVVASVPIRTGNPLAAQRTRPDARTARVHRLSDQASQAIARAFIIENLPPRPLCAFSAPLERGAAPGTATG